VLNRLAERRGVTTLAPLLQMVAKLRDVSLRVRLADVGEAHALLPAPQRGQLRSRLLDAIRRA
jgi:hypothetical protein